MAYINATSTGNFAKFLIRVNDGTDPVLDDFLSTGTGTPVLHTVDANVLDIPAMQDITITNNPNTARWKQLDLASERVKTTVSTNSVAGNLVIDPDTYFGVDDAGSEADDKGLFKLSNEKTQVDFLIAYAGINEGDYVVYGKGYFTNLSPTLSAEDGVWKSPFTLEVDGDYTQETLGATI